MFGSDIIDAAIGLFLVYFLFSLLCSAINEWIVGHWCGLRAAMIETGIERMLGNKELAKDFLKLPLIKSLAPDDKTNPSYLSSSTFADGLLALVTNKATGVSPEILAKAGTDLDSLHKVLDAIPAEAVQPILKSLLAGARDASEARQKIEKWFEEGMDRATGWYKKQVRYWMLGIAVAVAIGFNVDTFVVVKELMGNSKLRAALVASAEETVKQPVATNDPAAGSNTVAAIEKKITGLQLPIGWLKFTNPIAAINLIQSVPGGTTNEINMNAGTMAAAGNSSPPTTWLRPGQTLPMLICGWIVTAAALSFGAPFWFDMLNKVVNVRAAGTKPKPAKPIKKKQ